MNKTIEIKYSENGLMTEDSFKEVWQSGAYHNIYMSPAEYIQFIHTYVEEYGLPFDKDTKLYRASSSGEENESSLSGGSWTTSIDDAFRFANNWGLDRIYSMVIPQGTKSIYIKPALLYPEKENIIDTYSVKNDTLQVYATRIKVDCEKGKVVTRWRLANGKVVKKPCHKRVLEMMKGRCLKAWGHVA